MLYVFSMFGAWGFCKTHSCNCTTILSISICINLVMGSHQVSPEQGKSSLAWWAHARYGSSEPCAREPNHTRSKRITSTWASAAVCLIHSSRFQFNIKHYQEEKMREALIAQSVPRHCCWGLYQESCLMCAELQSVLCLRTMERHSLGVSPRVVGRKINDFGKNMHWIHCFS